MIITNNKIKVFRDDIHYKKIEQWLIKFDDDGSINPLYSYCDGGIDFGRGLYFLLKSFLGEIEDKSEYCINYPISYNFKDYRNLLEGYTLREDQIIAIIKALEFKRGIFQMATGSGKSLCIAGILKYLSQKIPVFPKTILLEPTNYLVSEMCERMQSYGIPAVPYFSSRRNLDEDILYISHPASLCNDLKRDSNLLNGIKILIADEAHHEHSETWSKIYNSCNRIELSLGFSAYLVDDHKINDLNFSILSYNEAKAISCTGPVLLNLSTAYYIRLGVLATPILIRMFSLANEKVSNERDWQELRVKRLESENRLNIICQTVHAFSKKGYKTLVLSNTKKLATDILCGLAKLEVGNKAICSFGSDEYWVADNNGGCELGDSRLAFQYKNSFAEGQITTMICTSHMFEGADIPNLDVVVLAEVGKKVRKIIQGIGRGLRKTKKGRYAYIIDFTDHEGGVLEHHSKLRADYCRQLIGIEQIYNDVVPNQLDALIEGLENSDHSQK